MSPKLGILVVHGMGSQTRQGFQTSTEDMIARIRSHVRDLGADPDVLAWERGYWGDILQRHEDDLLEKMAGSRLDWMWLRRFVINNLGDAVAYQRQSSSTQGFYGQIHECIHAQLLGLRTRLGNPNAPLIVMAHSLGGYIMSNYIWDHYRQNRSAIPSGSDFEKMRTLCAFITFGCNIPVLGLALDPFKGIPFPPAQLPEPLQRAARWLNFYDPDDVLGWPIKPLCREYQDNRQIEDHVIDVGGILSGWNPWSHDQYWNDTDFIAVVGQQIANLLKLIN